MEVPAEAPMLNYFPPPNQGKIQEENRITVSIAFSLVRLNIDPAELGVRKQANSLDETAPCFILNVRDVGSYFNFPG
jgi:hypothetical protein